MWDELEEIAYPTLLARIGLEFPEARVYIETLLANPDETNPARQYDVMWVSRSSEKMPFGGELMSARKTRAEMIERLEWIANEKFGEDLEEWASWLAAFEADTPPTRFR